MHKFYQILFSHRSEISAVLSVSLGVISNGIELGWSGPAIPKLREIDSPIKITHDHVFWLESLYFIGGACGLPTTYFALQYLGRKRSLLLSQTVGLICWILLATSPLLGGVSQLFVARFFSGMASNIIYIGTPMYTAEIAQPDLRGFLGSFVYSMSALGVLIGYCTVPFLPLTYSPLIPLTFALSMLLTFSFQPESPYYLLVQKNASSARKSLQILRPDRNIDLELNDISTAVERQGQEKGRFIDLFLIASNRKAMLIMTLLNVAQNMTGSMVIIMNAQSILDSAGTVANFSADDSAIVFALVMVLSSFLGGTLIDRFGRKFLLISSALMTALFLGMLGGFFIAKDIQGYDVNGLEWIPLFALIAYAFAFRFGIGIVPIVVTAELFPTSVRSMGMVMSDMWFIVMATVTLKIYQITVDTYGMYFPFMLFTVFALFAATVVAWYVPETKGKTLEQIQMILKGEEYFKKEDDIYIERI